MQNAAKCSTSTTVVRAGNLMIEDTSDALLLTWGFWQGSTVEAEKFHPVEQILRFVALIPMHPARNVCNTRNTEVWCSVYLLFNKFIYCN